MRETAAVVTGLWRLSRIDCIVTARLTNIGLHWKLVCKVISGHDRCLDTRMVLTTNLIHDITTDAEGCSHGSNNDRTNFNGTVTCPSYSNAHTYCNDFETNDCGRRRPELYLSVSQHECTAEHGEFIM